MDTETPVKKRVAVLSGLTYPVPPIHGGGPQIVLYNTCLNITDPNIDWQIYANWEPELDEMDFDRKKIHAIRTGWVDKLALALVNLLPYRIRKKIFSEVGDQERLLLNLKIVRKLLVQKTDIIVCHESYPLAYLVHLVFPRKKMITYVHNSKVHLDFDEDMWERYVHASPAGMILGSRASIRDLETRFKVMPPKIWVIYNGVDIEKFSISQKEKNRKQIREKYQIKPEEFVFIYCGRIAPIKNIDLVLSAFLELTGSYSKTRLVIVGSAEQDHYGNPSYQEMLQDMIPEKDREKVIFTGFISQENLPEIYSVADCGVLGTNKSETVTLFLLECMACGIPVIAPAVGAIPEVIHNDREGIVIDREYSQSEMVSAMRKMVEGKTEWAARAQAIEKYIQDDFSWKRVAKELTKILKEIDTSHFDIKHT